MCQFVTKHLTKPVWKEAKPPLLYSVNTKLAMQFEGNSLCCSVSAEPIGRSHCTAEGGKRCLSMQLGTRVRTPNPNCPARVERHTQRCWKTHVPALMKAIRPIHQHGVWHGQINWCNNRSILKMHVSCRISLVLKTSYNKSVISAHGILCEKECEHNPLDENPHMMWTSLTMRQCNLCKARHLTPCCQAKRIEKGQQKVDCFLVSGLDF